MSRTTFCHSRTVMAGHTKTVKAARHIHRQEAKTTEEQSDTKTCKLGREKKRLNLPGENDPDPNIWTKQ